MRVRAPRNALTNHGTGLAWLCSRFLRSHGGLASKFRRVASLAPFADLRATATEPMELRQRFFRLAGRANLGFHDAVLLNNNNGQFDVKTSKVFLRGVMQVGQSSPLKPRPANLAKCRPGRVVPRLALKKNNTQRPWGGRSGPKAGQWSASAAMFGVAA